MPGYHTVHHASSGDAGAGHSPSSSDRHPPSSGSAHHPVVPSIEPGLSFDGTATLHVRARRRLRVLELQTRGPFRLEHNGRLVCLVVQGQNRFEPPLLLEPGDTLRLEAAKEEGSYHG
jgi:hypothetical protein